MTGNPPTSEFLLERFQEIMMKNIKVKNEINNLTPFEWTRNIDVPLNNIMGTAFHLLIFYLMMCLLLTIENWTYDHSYKFRKGLISRKFTLRNFLITMLPLFMYSFNPAKIYLCLESTLIPQISGTLALLLAIVSLLEIPQKVKCYLLIVLAVMGVFSNNSPFWVPVFVTTSVLCLIDKINSMRNNNPRSSEDSISQGKELITTDKFTNNIVLVSIISSIIVAVMVQLERFTTKEIAEQRITSLVAILAFIIRKWQALSLLPHSSYTVQLLALTGKFYVREILNFLKLPIVKNSLPILSIYFVQQTISQLTGTIRKIKSVMIPLYLGIFLAFDGIINFNSFLISASLLMLIKVLFFIQTNPMCLFTALFSIVLASAKQYYELTYIENKLLKDVLRHFPDSLAGVTLIANRRLVVSVHKKGETTECSKNNSFKPGQTKRLSNDRKSNVVNDDDTINTTSS